MQKEVNLCDTCNKVIAVCSCHLCGKDSCQNCKKEINIGFNGIHNIFNFIVCERCELTMNVIDYKKQKMELLIENFLRDFKNIMMCAALEDSELEEKIKKLSEKYEYDARFDSIRKVFSNSYPSISRVSPPNPSSFTYKYNKTTTSSTKRQPSKGWSKLWKN